VSLIKNKLYDWNFLGPKKAPLPVISVGNIIFGGSEKTPLVMHLTSILLQKGYKPAIISRGYKGKWEKRGGVVSDGKELYGNWEEAGDEPYMAAKNYPQAGVFVGKDRLHSCREANKSGFQMAVLDDGFQHRRLYRDLDIVLFNPKEKKLLREARSSLRRAHIILIKKSGERQEKNKIGEIFPESSSYTYSIIHKGFISLKGKEEFPATKFRGKKAIAFCGIANPKRFSILLEEAGLFLIDFISFSDHYSYPPSSLHKLVSLFKKLKSDILITTEKDAIKLEGNQEILGRVPVYYTKIALDVDEKLNEKIDSILQQRIS
jgi:tetraacyldisaccharide 4'-kinase